MCMLLLQIYVFLAYIEEGLIWSETDYVSVAVGSNTAVRKATVTKARVVLNFGS